MEPRKINLPYFIFLFTILVCSAGEIILFEVKYNLFTGGFLQYNQLTTIVQKGGFIFFFLFFNVVLFGTAYLIWHYILGKINVRRTFIAFHFMMIAGIATTISLVVQFQLHKYFADAMDVALLKNLAGGDLKSALVYVLDEAFLFLIGIILLLVIYYLFYRSVKKFLIIHDNMRMKSDLKIGKVRRLVYYTCGMALTVAAVLFVNKQEILRYHFHKSNAYKIIVSALDFASDVDGDGYGSFRHPQDIDAFDPTIYPGALDIPGNDIDEDGFFGDFVTFIPPLDMAAIRDPLEKPKHIVTILMESTRADIIGKIIDGRLVAPNITRLAKEGQVIEEAYSHTGYTGSSLATFFSGHIGSFSRDKSIYPILKQYGYQLALFSGQDETWSNLDQKLGTRDYTSFFYDAQVGVDKRVFASKQPSSIKLSEKTLWQEFKKYSDNLDWTTPQFIYFNMQAGHFPYYHDNMTQVFVDKAIPRSEINFENRAWLQNTYWNAMNYADKYIGKIIAELKEKGVWQDTLLIVSGDHGEELFDDNHLGHGFFLSDVQTRIPFVLNQPDFKITQPIGHTDMMNIIFSSAINKSNSMVLGNPEDEKFVFQFIGSLGNPSKIALRYLGKKMITLDLRNMLVRPIGQNNWVPYDRAMNKPDVRADIKKLVLHWENLRWISHLEDNKLTK